MGWWWYSAPAEQFTDHGDGDQKTYEFWKYRTVKKRTNITESVGHLVKGCLGAGMLGMPWAYCKVGLWTAAVLNLIIGLYITYCVQLLVKCAQTLYFRLHIPSMSYSELAEAALATCPSKKLRKYSSCFRAFVDITICLDLFGACACYEIFIAKTVKQLVENSQMPGIMASGNSPHLSIYILFVAVPVLILCMIRELKYLAPFSLVADVLIMVSLGTTIHYCFKGGNSISSLPAFRNYEGLAVFLGICVFSMEGIGIALAIENNMKEPLKFNTALAIAMSIVVSTVTLIGFFGYWAYGDLVDDMITLSFPIGDILPMIVKVSMAVIILVTFSLNFWVPFNIVWIYLKKKFPENRLVFWELVFRAIHVVLITALAAAFPKMGNMMGLIGSFCLSLMGFIYPALIDIMVHTGKLRARFFLMARDIIFIILGVMFLGFGSFVNGRALISEWPPW